MHSCLTIVTKELPSNELIAEIMKPYDENGDEMIDLPLFTWDCYETGGRYDSRIKFNIEGHDENFRYAFHTNNYNLFISRFLSIAKEKLVPYYSESNYYKLMGHSDGHIRVDGAWIKDVMNLDDLSGGICIDKDGEVIARTHWNGENWIEDEEYESKFSDIIKNSQDCFMTVLDIHY